MIASKIIVGSRKSPLALAQVQEIYAALNHEASFELVTFDTAGDRDKVTSLTSQPADNFFTDTLDQAILSKKIDIAIHSAKDLPKILPDGLTIFALTSVLDDTDSWVGKLPWANLPAGATIGTSSILRQRQALELHPKARIVDIRGTIQERLDLVSQGRIDGVIIATCALKRLKMAEKITDILPWDGMPLQGQLAVVGRADDLLLKRLFAPLDARAGYGKVILVGAGPGDPGLITQRGIEAMRKADCILYDFLVNKEILQYAPHATHIYTGKRKLDHSLTQEQLCRMLKEKTLEGLNIVRLKGGDPLIFGRGADEINYLRNYHIDVHVIPGVSSATGIPAALGVPLTARGVATSVSFVSAHAEDEDIKGSQPIHIPKSDTVVFLMGLSKIDEIIATLKKDGWPLSTPVLIVANGTRENEQILTGTLESIEGIVKAQKVSAPALIVVGKTTEFYQYRRKHTYLHCGTHPGLYYHLGRIISWPMISLKPVTLSDSEKLRFSDEFDVSSMVILTSPNAVKHFMPMISTLKNQAQIKSKIYAVIGQHSADTFASYGGHAHLIAEEETAQGLYQILSAICELKGKKIFFPRSSVPNPFLRDSLREQGATVYEWAVYENTKPERGPLPSEHIDGIIFTSPTTVANYLEQYGSVPESWDILAKGPVTHKALLDAGYRSKIML